MEFIGVTILAVGSCVLTEWLYRLLGQWRER